MKAELLYRFREDYSDGAILEAVIWRVPRLVPSSEHPYKYRLFYVPFGEIHADFVLRGRAA